MLVDVHFYFVIDYHSHASGWCTPAVFTDCF